MVHNNKSMGDGEEVLDIAEDDADSGSNGSFDTDSDDSIDVLLDDDDDDSDDADSDNRPEPVLENIEDDEDELVKAIKAAKQKVRDHPADIDVQESIVDISFHPENDLLATGLMDGTVLLYRYKEEGVNELIFNREFHTKACRGVEFNASGEYLYSISKDKSIVIFDMQEMKTIRTYSDSHDVPIYSVTSIAESTLVTGDDDGTVKMWDLRDGRDQPAFFLSLGADYISDMITNAAKKYLVCASGDGALSTINMNARKIHVQTEEYESEFTCLGLYKNETKILAGSTKGSMYMFNWGEFGYHTDEYPGIKQSVTCMVPITENIVVFSGEDGVLRAVHLFPHKHLGVVGQHSMNVERIDISHDAKYIASFSHNSDIKFWNIEYFEDVEVQTKKQNKRKDMKNNLPSSKIGNASDFFSGMS